MNVGNTKSLLLLEWWPKQQGHKYKLCYISLIYIHKNCKIIKFGNRIYSTLSEYYIRKFKYNKGFKNNFWHSYKKLVSWICTATSNLLADGVQVNISEIWVNTNCSFNDFGTYDACARIQVDLNGAKGPNTIGRDVFLFALKENGLFPYGCDDLSYCASHQGWGCACKVIRENAMNY